MKRTDTFSNVIIWGHKIFSHTHSYIHHGFHKAFNYLGHECHWLDENDDISKIDMTNSLFITEGQVDKNIPLIETAFYILHNCDGNKYSSIPRNNRINLQVFTLDCTEKYNAKEIPGECGHYLEDCAIISWGTDLLPYEINKNILFIDKIKSENEINFVGMPTPPWDTVKEFCNENNLQYKNYGGFNRDTSVDCKTNMDLIQKSIVAPSLQEEWQVANGYIPCRIFKNISYGKMGVTNNPTVQKLFNNKLIFGSDIKQILQEGIEFNDKDKLLELMKEVRDKHTYINRINAIFWLINKNYS